MRTSYAAILLSLIFIAGAPAIAQAAFSPEYPRLANYFLSWKLTETDAKELAKWDVVVLDMEVAENSPQELDLLRRLNPDLKIIAYITSQEIYDDPAKHEDDAWREELYAGIEDSWWLRDSAGAKISHWAGSHMLNLNTGFSDYLHAFIRDRIQASGRFDGVFLDNLWGNVSFVNGGDIDIDNDGDADPAQEIDIAWRAGVEKLIFLIRSSSPSDFAVIGNGQVYFGYQSNLNGMMLESFPSSWENGGTWAGSMKSYNKLASYNLEPKLAIINANDTDRANYRKMRFSLGSALLGDGYFSFDFDVSNHAQTWWYDEYDAQIGNPVSAPFNLISKDRYTWQPGLWRRDFTSGIVLVNSTSSRQRYLFGQEQFEKLSGLQDPITNDGKIINWISLEPNDGILLYKRQTEIRDATYQNGYFARIFNEKGAQPRNGFFAYQAAYPAGSVVLQSSDLSVYSYQGEVRSNLNVSFRPYGDFAGQISLAVGDIDGDGRDEIITGAGSGGGPHVRIFSASGKAVGGFFAYDKNFRGGVNVGYGYIDGETEPRIFAFSSSF